MAAEFSVHNYSGATINDNISEPYYFAGSENAETVVSEVAQFIVNGIVVPTIAMLGILGNILNLAILSWRSWNKEDDTLEKVALVGLISLAASDLCFCLTIVPTYAVWKPSSFDYSRSFALLYIVYGGYFQNIFIKTSTWLTTMVATSRYIAICHPLRARMCFGLTPTKVAIISTYAFWAVFSLPLLWEFQIIEYPISNVTSVYVIDLGALSKRPVLMSTCTYVWALIGYFVPVAMLAYCNVCLIIALRQSQLLRESVASSSRTKSSSAHQANHRITLTLILLVIMFILLVSPSELLHFCNHISHETAERYSTIETATLVCNILQAINFAFHFVLYCVVNVTFRRTLINMAFVFLSFIQSSRLTRQKKSLESFSRRSTLGHSALRSHETHI